MKFYKMVIRFYKCLIWYYNFIIKYIVSQINYKVQLRFLTHAEQTKTLQGLDSETGKSNDLCSS